MRSRGAPAPQASSGTGRVPSSQKEAWQQPAPIPREDRARALRLPPARPRNTASTLLARIWTQKTSVSRKYSHLSNPVIYMHSKLTRY
ncbi:uncharacterized protein [Odocoileus virginianus]|uniref:Uncharacterized protein n=1 Tax=Odocoileus virginianus TaxID=9874 RepID=A0ABM4HXN1_ODOVR